MSAYRTGRRQARLVIASAATALVMAGCGSLPFPGATTLPIGGGVMGTVSWSAVVYRSSQEGTCVEVRWSSGRPDKVCGGSAGRTGTFIVEAPDGSGTVAVADVLNGSMKSGVVSLRDGASVAATIADLSADFGRFVVGAVPAPGIPTSFLLRNADGDATDTIPLR